jgi:hypothetical protein
MNPVPFFIFNAQGIAQRAIGRPTLVSIGNNTRFAMKTDDYPSCCQAQQAKEEQTATHTRIQCQACGRVIAEWPRHTEVRLEPVAQIQTDTPVSRERAAFLFKQWRETDG